MRFNFLKRLRNWIDRKVEEVEQRNADASAEEETQSAGLAESRELLSEKSFREQIQNSSSRSQFQKQRRILQEDEEID